MKLRDLMLAMLREREWITQGNDGPDLLRDYGGLNDDVAALWDEARPGEPEGDLMGTGLRILGRTLKILCDHGEVMDDGSLQALLNAADARISPQSPPDADVDVSPGLRDGGGVDDDATLTWDFHILSSETDMENGIIRFTVPDDVAVITAFLRKCAGSTGDQCARSGSVNSGV